MYIALYNAILKDMVFAFWELTQSKTSKDGRERVLLRGYTKQIHKTNK